MNDENSSYIISVPIFGPIFPVNFKVIKNSAQHVKNQLVNDVRNLIKNYLNTGLPMNTPSDVCKIINNNQFYFCNSTNYRKTQLYYCFLSIKYEILKQTPKEMIILSLRWEHFLDIVISFLEGIDPSFPQYFNYFYIDLDGYEGYVIDSDELDSDGPDFFTSMEVFSMPCFCHSSFCGLVNLSTSDLISFDEY